MIGGVRAEAAQAWNGIEVYDRPPAGKHLGKVGRGYQAFSRTRVCEE